MCVGAGAACACIAPPSPLSHPPPSLPSPQLLGMLFAECTILLLPLDVGNKVGLVGCGVWNNNCGGLDLSLAWEIAYCCIALLVVVVFPFFIFFYEADDEGMEAEATEGSTCLTRCLDFRNCKRAFLSALCYELLTLAISLLVVFLCYNYLNTTNIPYYLTTVPVGTPFFGLVGSPLEPTLSQCPTGTTPESGTCVTPCGSITGANCTWLRQTLSMNVTFIVFLAALMSFVCVRGGR